MSAPFSLPYAAFAVLGLIVAFSFRVSSVIPRPERRKYYLLQAITLIGALWGAKLAQLVGDLGWPFFVSLSPNDFLYSGRSVVGGLFFGLVCGEAAKPLLGYTQPPNDRFAALLPFSIAIGRVGCHLGGCCRGLPHEGWLSVSYADAVQRHPIALYEIAFQLATGAVFFYLLRARRFHGRLFALYLVLYGVFRIATEPLRATPKLLYGYSMYQAMCLLLIATGALLLILRAGLRPTLAAPLAQETSVMITFFTLVTVMVLIDVIRRLKTPKVPIDPNAGPQQPGAAPPSAAPTVGSVLLIILAVMVKVALSMMLLGALGVALLFGLIISVCGK